MFITADDLLALIDEAQEQGCAWESSMPCKGQTYSLRIKLGGEPKAKWRTFATTGCGHDTIFRVKPLTPAENGDPETFATVCAHDDAMGLWPRFEKVVTDDESFEPLWDQWPPEGPKP